MIKTSILIVATTLGLTVTAAAAPSLRSEVTVIAEIVTVGDMFDMAGELSEKALFRSPLPGTTGIVTLEQVRDAAAMAGIAEFEADGVTRVRVARAVTLVDEAALATLVADDLAARGIAGNGVVAQTSFDSTGLSYSAEAVPEPARLLNLRYMPASGTFSARFQISGIDLPVDLSGSIELMIEAPHLATSLPAGTILSPSDIELKLVPLRFAEAAGAARLEDLVGKQLQRQSRTGLMLRAKDVSEPVVVQRNSEVTVYLQTGPMTLSVRGQALNSASAGEPVQVLNPVSRKIVHGIALANGSVGLSNTLNVAGL